MNLVLRVPTFVYDQLSKQNYFVETVNVLTYSHLFLEWSDSVALKCIYIISLFDSVYYIVHVFQLLVELFNQILLMIPKM